MTPDTKRFPLDRVAPFVEEADRPVVVAAAIAIIRRAECRTQAGEIDSRFIVAQRQSLMLVTLLWQWPMERLNQSWERLSTLSKAIANLRQQSNPIAPALASHLELDLTPEQLNWTSPSVSKTEAVKTNFEQSSTAPKPSPEAAPKSTKSKGTEPTKPRDEAPIELPTGALLDSPQIVDAIARNTTIAREDYDWTRQELEPVAKAFATLTRDLGQRAKELEKVGQGKPGVKQAAAKQMAELYDKLERTRTRDLENLRTILKRKRDAIGHFTLAMMGRTKAGKSTLFATLLGSGYEGIGKGLQRTTRENRVYELENGIRLVDTPGIAAAGGEADELEALKAVDGADLICYVMVDDSIQESEFEFLKKLKDKTKPLLILLNVQKDLTNVTRLKLFLKNPDKLMSSKTVMSSMACHKLK